MLRTILLCLALALGTPCSATQQPSTTTNVRIVVPASVLHNQEVPVRVEGLSPNTLYDLRAEWVSRAGTVWRAAARFTSDASGTIDLATAAPASGSYEGADASGLFWSMESTEERQTDPSRFETDDQSVVTISVHNGETALATARVTLRKRAVGVAMVELRDGLVGTLYFPYGATERVPGVVVLGGSEGGIPRDVAALLASRGFAALALAYFGATSLPNELERIPLEYVDRAIAWLQAQPSVDPKRIALVGSSKGAELALLVASRNAAVGAVVAAAPSSVVFQSITNARATSSSWSAGGKELEYAPYVVDDAFRKSRRLADLYAASLAAAPAAAEIPVEKIRAPILLLAGKDDALWPSSAMAERLAERARRNGGKPSVMVLAFDDVGHHVARMPMRPTGDSVRLGGTPRAIARAQLESWRAMVGFLEERLGVRR